MAAKSDDRYRASGDFGRWSQNVKEAPIAMLPVVSRKRGRNLYAVSVTPLALSNHMAR